MRAEVTVGSTANGPRVALEAAQALEKGGYDVRHTRVEQRSDVGPGELITIYITWKLAEPYVDEFMREMARETVKALRRAKRAGRRVQGMVRFDAPPNPRPFVEYILGEDVPDEALDLIEADAAAAPRRTARVWDRERRRWTSIDELMVEQHPPPAEHEA